MKKIHPVDKHIYEETAISFWAMTDSLSGEIAASPTRYSTMAPTPCIIRGEIPDKELLKSLLNETT